ncbi:MAG: M23 family metallopeptidase [Clostridia bacterium]|nr:M23 family metallopeptidase [Clostridia bacterium]
MEWSNNNEPSSKEEEKKKSYIKWFEFNVSYDVLVKTSQLDINSHTKNEEVKFNWIELISYLACKYGNNFDKFKSKDLDAVVARLKAGETMDEITKDMKYYSYYFEGYDSALHEFIGEYQIQKNTTASTPPSTSVNNSVADEVGTGFTTVYGLKAFHPIAKNYSYSHYDDFGNSRSYGYKRLHFGNDLMGSIGTPVIAVESGTIEALGWNQYGGWRIGIRSFDQKRYYYYAHLRKDHPYAENMYEGKIVQAGDVIGYLGMTGYSAKENVNNINIPHLHFGIQLIFDEVQKEGPNQIWLDLYALVDFLKKNRGEIMRGNPETKDYVRKYEIIDPIVPD